MSQGICTIDRFWYIINENTIGQYPRPGYEASGWWKTRIHTNTGAGDTILAIKVLNLFYSTSSWILFWYLLTGIMFHRKVVSASWMWRHVISSPATNPLLLQLLILLHSMTQVDIYVIRNSIQHVSLKFSSSFPINHNCNQYIAVVKYCILCIRIVWLLDGVMYIRPWARGVHHEPRHIPTKLCFSEPSECPQ